MSKIRKYALHDLFIAGIIIKGSYGILELIGGITLLFIKSDLIVSIVRTIFQHELAQDPTDWIATFLIQASQHTSASTLSFVAVYLIGYGAINVGLNAGLWFKKLWAYPLAGIVISLLVVYQIVRLFNTHSLILLFLTLIDIIILILLRFEYKRLTHTLK